MAKALRIIFLSSSFLAITCAVSPLAISTLIFCRAPALTGRSICLYQMTLPSITTPATATTADTIMSHNRRFLIFIFFIRAPPNNLAK